MEAKTLRGHSSNYPRKKRYFCEFFELINENIDVGFVRLDKYTLEIHQRKFF